MPVFFPVMPLILEQLSAKDLLKIKDKFYGKNKVQGSTPYRQVYNEIIKQIFTRHTPKIQKLQIKYLNHWDPLKGKSLAFKTDTVTALCHLDLENQLKVLILNLPHSSEQRSKLLQLISNNTSLLGGLCSLLTDAEFDLLLKNVFYDMVFLINTAMKIQVIMKDFYRELMAKNKPAMEDLSKRLGIVKDLLGQSSTALSLDQSTLFNTLLTEIENRITQANTSNMDIAKENFLRIYDKSEIWNYRAETYFDIVNKQCASVKSLLKHIGSLVPSFKPARMDILVTHLSRSIERHHLTSLILISLGGYLSKLEARHLLQLNKSGISYQTIYEISHKDVLALSCYQIAPSEFFSSLLNMNSLYRHKDREMPQINALWLKLDLTEQNNNLQQLTTLWRGLYNHEPQAQDQIMSNISIILSALAPNLSAAEYKLIIQDVGKEIIVSSLISNIITYDSDEHLKEQRTLYNQLFGNLVTVMDSDPKSEWFTILTRPLHEKNDTSAPKLSLIHYLNNDFFTVLDLHISLPTKQAICQKLSEEFLKESHENPHHLIKQISTLSHFINYIKITELNPIKDTLLVLLERCDNRLLGNEIVNVLSQLIDQLTQEERLHICQCLKKAPDQDHSNGLGFTAQKRLISIIRPQLNVEEVQSFLKEQWQRYQVQVPPLSNEIITFFNSLKLKEYPECLQEFIEEINKKLLTASEPDQKRLIAQLKILVPYLEGNKVKDLLNTLQRLGFNATSDMPFLLAYLDPTTLKGFIPTIIEQINKEHHTRNNELLHVIAPELSSPQAFILSKTLLTRLNEKDSSEDHFAKVMSRLKHPEINAFIIEVIHTIKTIKTESKDFNIKNLIPLKLMKILVITKDLSKTYEGAENKPVLLAELMLRCLIEVINNPSHHLDLKKMACEIINTWLFKITFATDSTKNQELLQQIMTENSRPKCTNNDEFLILNMALDLCHSYATQQGAVARPNMQ